MRIYRIHTDEFDYDMCLGGVVVAVDEDDAWRILTTVGRDGDEPWPVFDRAKYTFEVIIRHIPSDDDTTPRLILADNWPG